MAVTLSCPRLAARRAPSLTRFFRSAPEKPGVVAAISPKLVSSDRGTFLVCTFRMASRPVLSGRLTTTRRSNRPGLSRALSSTSGWLVAARTITPVLLEKPSISVRIWFRVCSCSLEPPMLTWPLARPMASSSSMKMMAGAFSRAWLKRSRTLAAPTPTIISTNSAALMEKKGTPASPATAFARRVFPVPGAPTRRMPFGAVPPSLVYFSGSFRKSTISTSSFSASSMPATSLNVTFSSAFWSNRRALLFPSPMRPPMPPWEADRRNSQK